MELLNMSGIYKAFSGVSVLSGVELHVNVGEIHALLGENGAGKSTLMNILSGSYTADAGTVTFDGADITGSSIKQIEDAGIAFVHQELNLFNDLLAYENIFLGAEETTPWGSLKKRDMANKAAELFERLGVDIDPYALVDDLKPSEKQLLEISRALFRNAKLLILDEPTASLNTPLARLPTCLWALRSLIATPMSRANWARRCFALSILAARALQTLRSRRAAVRLSALQVLRAAAAPS